MTLPTVFDGADVIGTLARVLGGALMLDDAAALLRETEADVRARFGDADVAVAATREAVRMRLDGELIEARAQGLMPAYLDRLEGLLSDPDTSASVLVEVGRELGALSGSKVRSDARAKRAAGMSVAETGPLVVIHLPDRAGEPITIGGRVIEHGGAP
ncbi:hypothetical protein [Dyella sp. Tek66A03]|uniref:hypothetical protein n=1 Tax=Dyella sp. Tek66A03 TaxID=3458298 RepID=UPI00403EDE73